MGLDLNLAKSATDFVDYLLKFPAKLVEAVYGPKEAYLDRRERIARQAELAELRSIGKLLNSLVVTKYSVVPYLRQAEKNPWPERVGLLREAIDGVQSRFGELKSLLDEASFSSLALVVEASERIAKGQAVFCQLAEALDEEVVASGILADIAERIEALQAEAGAFLKRVDDHSKTIGHTRGS